MHILQGRTCLWNPAGRATSLFFPFVWGHESIYDMAKDSRVHKRFMPINSFCHLCEDQLEAIQYRNIMRLEGRIHPTLIVKVLLERCARIHV